MKLPALLLTPLLVVIIAIDARADQIRTITFDDLAGRGNVFSTASPITSNQHTFSSTDLSIINDTNLCSCVPGDGTYLAGFSATIMMTRDDGGLFGLLRLDIARRFPGGFGKATSLSIVGTRPDGSAIFATAVLPMDPFNPTFAAVPLPPSFATGLRDITINGTLGWGMDNVVVRDVPETSSILLLAVRSRLRIAWLEIRSLAGRRLYPRILEDMLPRRMDGVRYLGDVN